ncbi:MAG: 50S ribosomal protein L24 [Deinococcales bacterium]
MRLKRGDKVRVIAGKDKGAESEIMAVYPDKSRVLVRDVNVVKKTKRPTQTDTRGGFDEREAPIHISNVQIIDPRTGKPSRVAYKFEDGRKVRISKASGAELD